ncbi:transglycosylase domain-containing protein [Loigolactobacillus binensis]|uniref:Transglycosylase domain-containing protein n=1 Tax=Loigolactobacillus binensis TaxID=2559922 RepID=A0ABW3ECJ5_9LACO|nr:transglycosylase domain-containing protein [Loigolactobacillus binensis]
MLKDHRSRTDQRQQKKPDGFFPRLGHILGQIWHYIKRRLSFPDVTLKETATTKEAIIYYFDISISVIRSLLLHLLAFGLVVGALGLGLGLGYFASLISHDNIPSYTTMKNEINSGYEASNLYFANNVRLGSMRTNLVSESVSINQISPNLTKAITSTEDQYFYQHKGIVPKSVFRALLSSLTGIGAATGGSTLTQQLVKMQILNSETTFKRKATEILLALRVDKYFSKTEILQAYLNAATFGRNNKGQNVAGVQQAAEGLFGVPASQVNLAQAAFIAGLPQSPSVYTPYTNTGRLKKNITYGLERKDTVLFRMYRDNKISYHAYQAAKKYDLTKDFLPRAKNSQQSIKYGYVYNLLTSQAETIIKKQLYQADGLSAKKVNKDGALSEQYDQQAEQLLANRGYHIYSTINKPIYNAMQQVVKQQGSTLGQTYYDTTTDANGNTVKVKEPVQNGSVLLNNKTGAILGFIGGRNYSSSQLNHAFDTMRSPGSSIKPLAVYAPAIERKLIGSETKLADFKVNFNGYKPTDYGSTIQNRFINAREALKESYNIPAINLYNQVRKQGSVKPYLEKMGITTLTSNDYKNLGLALGGTDYGLTVADEASAYSTLSNNGNHTDSYVINKITDANGKVIYQHKAKTTKVYSAATAYITSNMMHSVVTSGTASQIPSQTLFDTTNLVGKTGTSNDNRDSWFVGSTPTVTLATWTGYDNYNGSSYNLTDSSSEITNQFWSNLANAVYTADSKVMGTTKTRKKPSGVTTASVVKATGQLPGSLTVSGSSVSASGTLVKSYYNGWQPTTTKEKFGIGGTAANYATFWKNYLSGNNADGALYGGEVTSSTSSTTSTE